MPINKKNISEIFLLRGSLSIFQITPLPDMIIEYSIDDLAHLFIYRSFLSVYCFTHLSIRPYACLCTYFAKHLGFRIIVRLSVHLEFCPAVCLYVYLVLRLGFRPAPVRLSPNPSSVYLFVFLLYLLANHPIWWCANTSIVLIYHHPWAGGYMYR